MYRLDESAIIKSPSIYKDCKCKDGRGRSFVNVSRCIVREVKQMDV
jgi:hypothetical protein